MANMYHTKAKTNRAANANKLNRGRPYIARGNFRRSRKIASKLSTFTGGL